MIAVELHIKVNETKQTRLALLSLFCAYDIKNIYEIYLFPFVPRHKAMFKPFHQDEYLFLKQ